MKVAKLFPYLLLIAAGAFAVPALIPAFAGGPTNTVYAGLSGSCLLLALLCLPFSQNSGGGFGPSEP